MNSHSFQTICILFYFFRSSAFRSHPLFPLLRDLVIADMNFHSPTFPFQVEKKILLCAALKVVHTVLITNALRTKGTLKVKSH